MLYSHSRLSTYEQCPLKFKFNYIDRAETETEDYIESFLGSRVHETLEWLYTNVKMTKIPTLKSTLSYYKKMWKENYNKRVKINKKGITANNYFNQGKKFIKKYYNHHKPFDENTIGMEMMILIDLDGTGKYKLQGFIDRLVYNEKENVYEIHDYKTNATLRSKEDLDQDRQLALYSIGIKNMFSDAKKVRLTWHFLAFDKQFYSDRTDEQLEKLKEDTIKLINKIEATKTFNAKVSSLCKWCEFKPICPKWKHLYEIESEEYNEYLKDTGVNLVNKYAELYAKKKQITEEIDNEIEKLKAAIMEYSKKKGIEVIFGSDNQLSISITEKMRFPGKNTEEREKLDEMLKKLKKWEEVATLDTYALDKKIEEDEWPKEIIDKVKHFSTIYKTESIRLSKRREIEY